MVDEWLENNRAYIIEITLPIVAQFTELLSTEDAAFHTDITEEFDALIKHIIATEMSKSLGIDASLALGNVSLLDIEEYLKEN